MSDILISAAVIVVSYLVGSIPASYLVGRYIGKIDIREYGSGNVGASNVSTHVGKVWAVLVALFDVFMKGTFPVLIASDKVLGLGDNIGAIAALAAMVGHNWPVFLGFSGGRGISVGVGAIVAFASPMLVLWASVPGVMLMLSPWRDSSVWWLIGGLLLPLWVFMAGEKYEYDIWVVWFCVGFMVITCVRRATSGSISDALSRNDGLTAWRLLLNRVIFDRDVSSRDEWVYQRPDG